MGGAGGECSQHPLEHEDAHARAIPRLRPSPKRPSRRRPHAGRLLDHAPARLEGLAIRDAHARGLRVRRDRVEALAVDERRRIQAARGVEGAEGASDVNHRGGRRVRPGPEHPCLEGEVSAAGQLHWPIGGLVGTPWRPVVHFLGAVLVLLASLANLRNGRGRSGRAGRGRPALNRVLGMHAGEGRWVGGGAPIRSTSCSFAS